METTRNIDLRSDSRILVGCVIVEIALIDGDQLDLDGIESYRDQKKILCMLSIGTENLVGVLDTRTIPRINFSRLIASC